MIGKAIGAIIVIILFLGILYSVGKNQQGTQQQGTQQQSSQQQNNQEEDNQEKSQKKKHKKNQEDNNQQQGSQEQTSQEQGAQEQSSQQQGSEEHTESETGSQSSGTVELYAVRGLEMETKEDNPCLRYLSGTIGNRGNMDAKNVIVEIEFLNENRLIVARGEIPVGDIPAGDSRDYQDVKNVCWGGRSFVCIL